MSVLNPNQSSVLQFIQVLTELKVVAPGSFVLADIQHDEGCPTLITQSNIDCRCCPNIIFGGYRYSFNAETGDVYRSESPTSSLPSTSVQ